MPRLEFLVIRCCILFVSALALTGCGRLWGGVVYTRYTTALASNPLAAYPIHGLNWNDYVVNNNGGTTIYNQQDAPCVGTETGYSGCIHGGEVRKMALTGINSCAGLAAIDALGAFSWTCDASSGTATMYSTGLNSGKNLSDLISGTSWKPNQLILTVGGTTVGQTASSVWWNNPITTVPNNSAGSVALLNSQGTIYVLNNSQSTAGYNIAANKVALVVMPGSTLTLNTSTSNCNLATGLTTGAANHCVVAAGSQNFIWLEGNYTGFDTTTKNLLFFNVAHSRLNNVTASGPFDNVWLDTSSDNLLTYVTAQNATTSGNGFWIKNASTYNTFTNVSALSNSGAGIHVDTGGASHNTFTNPLMDGNLSEGFTLLTGADYTSVTGMIVRNGSPVTYQTSAEVVSSHNTFSQTQIYNNYISTAGDGAGCLNLEVGATYNSITNLSCANNYSATVSIDSSLGIYGDHNTVTQVTWFNGNDDAVDISGNFNTLTHLVAAHPTNGGIFLTGGAHNIINGATFVGCKWGIRCSGGACTYDTFNQIVSSEGRVNGILLNTGGNQTFSQIMAVDTTGGDGISLNGVNNNGFFGNLVVGNNSVANCGVAGGVNPGLTGACANNGISAANLVTGKSLVGSFYGSTNVNNGRLYVDDPINASDASGSTPSYPSFPSATFDFINFANGFRGWGSDYQYDTGASGMWTAGAGRIWDYRLRAGDTVALGTSLDGVTQQAITANAICPTGVYGNATATNQDGQTYLLNAIEFVNDSVHNPTGNNNGLCETGEGCLYTPNFGAYQGEGTLVPCTFNDNGGTTNVTGAKIWGYSTNGASYP